MTKKTPIQKLIEIYQRMREEGDNDMRTVIHYAEEMQEEEKEQLIQAVCIEELITTRQDAEKWFELTYESND